MKNHPVNPVNPVKIFIRNIPENRQIPNVFKSSHENKDTTDFLIIAALSGKHLCLVRLSKGRTSTRF